MADRAVSDVVGFVLVVAIVVASVSVIYGTGFAGLQDARDAERVTNAERAFDILTDNFADIQRRGAPSRATEVRLSEAQLLYGDPVEVTINLTNDGTATDYSVQSDPIVFRATGDDSTVVYSTGARFRTDRGSALMRDEPPLLFVDRGGRTAAVIPIVQTRADGPVAVGGRTTALVRASLAEREVLLDAPSDADDNPAAGDPDGDSHDEYDVELTVETTRPRAVVWEAYLDEEIPWASDPCTRTGGTVDCSFQVETIDASVTRIDVVFE